MDVVLIVGFGLVVAAIVAVLWHGDAMLAPKEEDAPYERGLAEGHKGIMLDRRYMDSLNVIDRNDYLMGRRQGWNQRVERVIQERTGQARKGGRL